MRIYWAVIFLILLLSGCAGHSESRWNPFGWFGGRDDQAKGESAADVNPLLPRRTAINDRPTQSYEGVVIDNVLELKVEPTRSGAIILATGLASRQGAYDVRLLAEDENAGSKNGVLSYRLFTLYPDGEASIGSSESRRVFVAHSVTSEALRNVRTIRVTAANNSLQRRVP
ncbi:MAG: hypothetical protein OXE94_09130 [Aestuariivita sp.]|nr:hypothetical protein [Aestuariivita sp.]MCY4201779.1 hypothetical protein [Aestuariivita sp.]